MSFLVRERQSDLHLALEAGRSIGKMDARWVVAQNTFVFAQKWSDLHKTGVKRSTNDFSI